MQRLDDALTPNDDTPTLEDSTPQLRSDLLLAMKRYQSDVERLANYRAELPTKKKAWTDSIQLAETLLAQPDIDYELQVVLAERIELWNQLLRVSTVAHRPTDGAIWFLGVRIVGACVRAGVSVRLARNATIVEVLRLCRSMANELAERKDTRYNAFEYARDSLHRYRDSASGSDKPAKKTDP